MGGGGLGGFSSWGWSGGIGDGGEGGVGGGGLKPSTQVAQHLCALLSNIVYLQVPSWASHRVVGVSQVPAFRAWMQNTEPGAV